MLTVVNDIWIKLLGKQPLVFINRYFHIAVIVPFDL